MIAKRLFVSRVGTPKLHKTKAGKNIVTQNIYCFEKMSSQFWATIIGDITIKSAPCKIFNVNIGVRSKKGTNNMYYQDVMIFDYEK